MEEAEQLVGLVAGVTLLEKDACLDGRDCYVIGGVIRKQAITFGLKWSKGCFESSQVINKYLNRIIEYSNLINDAIHLIELPENHEINQEWREAVYIFLKELIEKNIQPTLGISLSRVPRQDGTDLWEALQYLQSIEIRKNLSIKISFQIIDKNFDLSDSQSILDFAKTHEINCDLSLDIYGKKNELIPYYQYEAYTPLNFDIRTPSFHLTQNAVMEIPHIDGLQLIQGEHTNLKQLFTSYTTDSLYRLTVALSRNLRKTYLEQLNLNSDLISLWHYFHVYNWSAPPNDILQLLLFDVEDFLQNFSVDDYKHLEKENWIWNSFDFLKDLRQKSLETGFYDINSILKSQVDLHQYLEERTTLTPDGEKLIELLPASLGKTLEIGSGYGLIARRIIERTEKYIGVDLRINQAHEINKLGGHGIIADIHKLPFLDNSFDTIIADNVIEHSYNPEHAFKEIRRILHAKGRLYALIPLDYKSSSYQLKAHFWKADEKSIRIVAQIVGLKIQYMEVLDLSELNYFGCFPASSGKTCLVIMEPKDSEFLDLPTNNITEKIKINHDIDRKITFDDYDPRHQNYKMIKLCENALLNLQSEVNRRDEILTNLQAEVTKRDEMLTNLQAKINDVQAEVNDNFIIAIEKKIRNTYHHIKSFLKLD
ncbi:class I SAM-dependent methyltransferase [Microcoleus sp. FACHB-53]|nr:class I SAM-dependent methyltransferase [Microcoleus sp. FACHB-53]